MFDVFFQIIPNFYRPVTSAVLIWKQAWYDWYCSGEILFICLINFPAPVKKTACKSLEKFRRKPQTFTPPLMKFSKNNL